MIAGGRVMERVLGRHGHAGLAISVLLLHAAAGARAQRAARRLAAGSGSAFGVVFRNPQSILCG